MRFRKILSAAGLAFACSLAPAEAEVLAINSASAIGDQPPLRSAGLADEADAVSFETQSDLDRGAPIAVAPETSTWATALLSFVGFGR
jgi:hypothetical protein